MSDLQRNLFFGNFIPNAAIAKGQQNDQYGQDNKKKNFFENARDSVYTNARALGKAYEAAIPNDIVRGAINGSFQNMIPGAGLINSFNRPQQQPQPKTLQDKQQIATRNLDTKGGAIAMNSAWNSVPVTAAKNLENIAVELPSYAGGFLGAMVPGAVAGKLANNQAFQKAAEIGSKIPGVKQLGEAAKGIGSVVAPAIGGIGGMMAPTIAGTVLPNVGNALNNYRSFATNTVNKYATPLITEDKIDPETWANLSERTKKYIQTRDEKYLPVDEKGDPRSLREELLNADRYRGFQRFQQEVLKDYQAGHVTRDQAINAMKQYKTTASAPNFATDMLADATNLIMGGAGKVGKAAKLAQGAAESGKISQIADRLLPENKISEIPQILDQYRPNAAGSPDILDPSKSQGIGVDKNYSDYMKSIPRNQSPGVLDSQGQLNYLTETIQPTPDMTQPFQRKGTEQINFKRKGGKNEIPSLNEKIKGQKTPEVIAPGLDSNLSVDKTYAARLGEKPTIQQGYSGQNSPELQVRPPKIDNFDGKVDLNSVPIVDSNPNLNPTKTLVGEIPQKSFGTIDGSGSPNIQEIRPISDVIEQSIGRKEGELLGKQSALASATDSKLKRQIRDQIRGRQKTINEYKQEVLDKRTQFKPLGTTFNPETEKFVDNLSNDLYDNFTAAPIVDDIVVRGKDPVKFKNKLQEVMYNLGTVGRIKERALKPEEEHYVNEAKKFFTKNYGFDEEAFAKFADEGGYVRANILKGLDQGWAKEAYKGLGPEGYTADKLRKLSRIPSTQDIPEVGNQDLQDISNQIEREFGVRQGSPELNLEREFAGVTPEGRESRISNRNSTLKNSTDTPKAVETPEFKKWFGDSKVVDKSGEPLVVFHGTDSDFNVFDKSKQDSDEPGFFFAKSPKVAGAYAEGRNIFETTNHPVFGEIPGKKIGETFGNVKPVYLNLRNPLELDLNGKEYDSSAIKGIINRAKEAGHDGVIVSNMKDVSSSRLSDSRMNQTQYIAFEPNQIKSTTGNSGKFNPENPDIRERKSEEMFANSSNKDLTKSKYDEYISGVGDKPLKSFDQDYLTATQRAISEYSPELDRTISNNLNLNIPRTVDKDGNTSLGYTLKSQKSSGVVSLPELDSDVANHEGVHQMFDNISKIPELSLNKELEGLKSFKEPFKEMISLLKDRGYDKVETDDLDEILTHSVEVLYGDSKNLAGTRLREFNEIKDILDRHPEFRKEVDNIIKKTFENADIADQMVYKVGDMSSKDKDIKNTLDYIGRNYSMNTDYKKVAERDLKDIEDSIRNLFVDEPKSSIKNRTTGPNQINPDYRGIRQGQSIDHFMRTPDELALEKNYPPMKISDFTKEIDDYVESQQNKRSQESISFKSRSGANSYEGLKSLYDGKLTEYKRIRSELKQLPETSENFSNLSSQLKIADKEVNDLAKKLHKTPEYKLESESKFNVQRSEKLKSSYDKLQKLDSNSSEYLDELHKTINELNLLGAQIPKKSEKLTAYFEHGSPKYKWEPDLNTVAHEESHQFNIKALHNNPKFLKDMTGKLDSIMKKYSIDENQLKNLYKETSDQAQRYGVQTEKPNMRAILKELHSDLKAYKISGEVEGYPFSRAVLNSDPKLIDDIYREIILPIDKKFQNLNKSAQAPTREILDIYNDVVPKAFEKGIIPYNAK